MSLPSRGGELVQAGENIVISDKCASLNYLFESASLFGKTNTM
jgi:hypothetical protein